jgi:peroxiredoxin Q/BCP
MDAAEIKKVEVGDAAPDFTLPDQWGGLVSLKGFRGRVNVVLYFYLRDGTPGCSAEAAAFRDNYRIFRDLGTEVIGISSDSVESHCDFSTSRNIPFKLLSDANGKVRRLYGVKPTLRLIPGRVTYVIDRQGIVRCVISSQLQPQRHSDKALQAVNTLSQLPPGGLTSQSLRKRL